MTHAFVLLFMQLLTFAVLYAARCHCLDAMLHIDCCVAHCLVVRLDAESGLVAWSDP
jgi:hypothetical protein